MNALNNLGIAFTSCLFGLSCSLYYSRSSTFSRRRRRFSQRSVTSSSADEEFSSGCDSAYMTPSKELCYFFYRKNQTTRVELDRTSNPATSTVASSASTDGIDALVEEMLKLQGMYGPSRVLFTIKEEDREEMEVIENDKLSIENELAKTVGNDVVVDVEFDGVTTPFWTPCASP
ncbi:unnamed protein product [Dovyalis caffra]|uniref:Uncharacterized protein n=1 Tax=Dovyalis caffra TaxID=77055 RepID=A0AAV1S0U0_9ROSI|nr:unnamed protein product [Dovyalis caffra]